MMVVRDAQDLFHQCRLIRGRPVVATRLSCAGVQTSADNGTRCRLDARDRGACRAGASSMTSDSIVSGLWACSQAFDGLSGKTAVDDSTVCGAPPATNVVFWASCFESWGENCPPSGRHLRQSPPYLLAFPALAREGDQGRA